MQYLSRFEIPDEKTEAGYILSFPPTLEMSCYTGNAYPFKVFPQKRLSIIDFAPLTIFYGGNGSGKSTLLNIMAQKLRLKRSAPFNETPLFEDYLEFCRYKLTFGKEPPQGSSIITSDDVFDFLLDIRAINNGVDSRREELFAEYSEYNDPNKPSFRMRSLDDYEELKRRNEARGKSKSKYTARRIPKEVCGKSNGESAFGYFTRKIEDNALYLLDEPENSLSAKLQTELAEFIENSIRFYNCQFVMSTHSPFLLSMRGAKIYDLDSVPACVTLWTELENIKIYHDFFEKHRDEFK